MALATTRIASSWPTTRWCSASSMRSNLSRSPSIILDTGMPVQRDTTSATSFSVTALRRSLRSLPSAACAAFSCFSSSGMRPYCSSDMRARSPARRAVSISRRARSRASLMCAAPCTCAFSAFQTSSRSAYSRSSFPISPSITLTPVLPPQLPALALEPRQVLPRRLVGFLLERLALDLELDQPSVEPVHDLRLGVYLHADARGRLVPEVYGLVRG